MEERSHSSSHPFSSILCFLLAMPKGRARGQALGHSLNLAMLNAPSNARGVSLVRARRRSNYASVGVKSHPHLHASFRRVRGRRGGSTGGGDSSLVVAGLSVASIIVRGKASGTTPKPVTDARRGSRPWPISPPLVAPEEGCRMGSPSIKADMISPGTTRSARGRAPCSHTRFLNMWWLLIFKLSGTTMLSVGLPGKHGA